MPVFFNEAVKNYELDILKFQ